MNLEGVTAVLEQVGCGRVRPYKDNTKVAASCPLAPWFHKNGTDRHPSFKVKIDDEGISFCDCFACGLDGSSTLVGVLKKLNALKGGGLEDLLKKTAANEEGDLGARLQGEKLKYMYDYQDPDFKKAQKRRMKDYPVHPESALKTYAGKVPKYLTEQRRIPLEVCKEFQLGYDRRARRAVIPIRDEEGQLVGLQGRAIDPGVEPPWLNYWNFPKSKFVFGLHRVIKGKPLIVMEGVFDALVWTGYGINNCVSIFGSKPATAQIRKLGQRGTEIWMAYDGDEAGRKAEAETIEMLDGRVPLYRLSIPEGMDPDDLTQVQAMAMLGGRSLVL